MNILTLCKHIYVQIYILPLFMTQTYHRHILQRKKLIVLLQFFCVLPQKPSIGGVLYGN